MRIAIDMIIVSMVLLVAAAAIGWRIGQKADRPDQIEQATVSLHLMNEQLTRQRTIGLAELNEHGYPAALQLHWFAEMPDNPMARANHPWLDLAPPGDLNADPPDPVLVDPGQGAFWYNPNNGVIRARVPAELTDTATAELYNAVNGTAFTELANRTIIDRQPLAYLPQDVDPMLDLWRDTAAAAQPRDEPDPTALPVVPPKPVSGTPAPNPDGRPTLRGRNGPPDDEAPNPRRASLSDR